MSNVNEPDALPLATVLSQIADYAATHRLSPGDVSDIFTAGAAARAILLQQAEDADQPSSNQAWEAAHG